MAIILGNFKKITKLDLQNSIFVAIQIPAYKSSTQSATHFSQFISVKVKKLIRQFQAHLQEKLPKLMLR